MGIARVIDHILTNRHVIFLACPLLAPSTLGYSYLLSLQQAMIFLDKAFESGHDHFLRKISSSCINSTLSGAHPPSSSAGSRCTTSTAITISAGIIGALASSVIGFARIAVIVVTARRRSCRCHSRATTRVTNVARATRIANCATVASASIAKLACIARDAGAWVGSSRRAGFVFSSSPGATRIQTSCLPFPATFATELAAIHRCRRSEWRVSGS